MAYRTKTVRLCNKSAEGPGYVETLVELTMSVSIQQGTHPVVVQGYGINEARFETLLDVHNTFCRFMAPIRLDYEGCKEIEWCLTQLGFERPPGYFT